jgi:hypothetical protein
MISQFTNAQFLALGQREQRGEVRIHRFKPILGMTGGYEVDWVELPKQTPPRASQTPAQGVPEPKPPVVAPMPVSAKVTCHDCQTEHDDGRDCPICAPLYRAMIANRKLRRDRQLEKQFKSS